MTTIDLQARITELEAENNALRAKLDYAEALAGIKRGLDEAHRGLGKPLHQVDQEFRAKYDIPRL